MWLAKAQWVVVTTATQPNWVAIITAQVQRYVADVLRQHYTRYNDYMSKEADMRRELQRYVTTLEVGSGDHIWLEMPHIASHVRGSCHAHAGGPGCGSNGGLC